MPLYLSILLAVCVFGLIVFVHEMGHLIAAKLSGIAVYQFNIGFGPALWKKKWKDTLYAVRLIPLGGAVMMKGDDEPEEGQEDIPGLGYNEVSLWKRFCVSVSGALMNFLTGLIILLILMSGLTSIPTAKLTGFAKGFQYQGENGFLPGDTIVKINNFTIFTYSDINLALTLGEGQPMDITLKRDGKKITLQDLPLEKNLHSESEPDKPIYGFFFAIQPAGFFERLGYAFDNSLSFLQSAVKSVGMLARGQVKSSDMIGTVGIATEISDRAQQSLSDMWYFVAFLSINLGMVNMLPLPALDGGKVIFLFLEFIRRKPLNPKIEGYINAGGLIALFGLFFYLTYHDILKLIAR